MVVATRFLLALAYHLKPSLSSWLLAVTLSGSLAPFTTFARTALSPPLPQESNLLSLNNPHLPSFLGAKTLNALLDPPHKYTRAVIKTVVLELTRTPASTKPVHLI